MLGALRPRNHFKRIFPPFPYQVEFFDAVQNSWTEFKRSLAVLPTGGGKTFASGEMICRTVEQGKRVLVLAHTRKLVKQFAKSMIEQYELHVTIEMGTHKSEDSPVIVASMDTMANRIKQGKFQPDDFDLIVIDEAHRVLGDSYQAICKFFNNTRVLGITATPRRSDQKCLMTFFETKAIDIPLDRLIREGFLCPLRVRNIPIHIKIEGKSKTGDITEKEAAHAIEPYLESIADAMITESKGRCTLVFLPLISTSKLFTSYLKDRGLKAGHVDGQMDESEVEDAIRRLELGELDILCCSMILSEGVDIRPVNQVLILRPTKSWVLYTQMIGRETRLFDPAKHGLPGTKWPLKTDAVILDPLWLCDEHSLLQRPASLLSTSEEETVEIEKKIKEGGGMLDLMTALTSVQNDRAEKIAKRLKELAHRKEREVDAMELFLKMGKLDLLDYEPVAAWESGVITEGQRNILLRNNIDIESVKDKGHATKIIDAIIERTKAGQSTIKQSKYASTLGMVDAWNRSFEDVSQFIALKKQGDDPYAGIEDIP